MEEFIKEVSPFRRFSREEWAALRADTPMTLTQADLDEVRGLNDRIDLAEVEAIYRAVIDLEPADKTPSRK